MLATGLDWPDGPIHDGNHEEQQAANVPQPTTLAAILGALQAPPETQWARIRKLEKAVAVSFLSCFFGKAQGKSPNKQGFYIPTEPPTPWKRRENTQKNKEIPH